MVIVNYPLIFWPTIDSTKYYSLIEAEVFLTRPLLLICTGCYW